MLEYFTVGKRIGLYLARISPQQTMDHLVFEISLQVCDSFVSGISLSRLSGPHFWHMQVR